MITVPMIGWAPKLGSGRSILYSYSRGQIRPANRPPTRGCPTRATASAAPTATPASPVMTPTTQIFPPTRLSSRPTCSICSSSGAPPRMAACLTTSWTTSTASGFPRIRTCIRSAPPCRKSGPRCLRPPAWSNPTTPTPWWRAGRMGLERLFLQRLRPTMVRPTRQLQPGRLSGPRHQRRLGLYALAAQPVSSARHQHRPAVARLLHPPLLSAGERGRWQ